MKGTLVQTLQLLKALLAAGDINAAIALEATLGRQLTNGELLKCAKALIRWLFTITGSQNSLRIGRSARECEAMISTIAARLGDNSDQLYAFVCDEFLVWHDHESTQAQLSRLSTAEHWCYKIKNKRIQGNRILAMAITSGGYHAFRDACVLANTKVSKTDRLQMLIMARYSSNEIWGAQYAEQLGYCFRGLSETQKQELITQVIDHLITNGNLVIAIRFVIPMLPKKMQAAQTTKVIAPIVGGGDYYQCMLEDLKSLGRPMTTNEFFAWYPTYLKRRDADPRVPRQAIANLPKADQDKANSALAKSYYRWAEQSLLFAHAIRSKRLKHAVLEYIFFGLLEWGMHPLPNQRSGECTYRDIATFSTELAHVHDKPRLRRLFREACNTSYQHEYAECMIPLFPPAQREAAVERLIASHITHHDMLCGRQDAIAAAEKLSPVLRDKYRETIGHPEVSTTTKSA